MKMSKHQVDTDDFQIVKSKRCAKNKHTRIPSKQTQFIKQENHIDVKTSHQRILRAVEDLNCSNFLSKAFKAVSTSLNESKLPEIVCLGLGHIGECNISRYQLAFLVCLKNYFKSEKVLVHDPIFYTGECELLKRLGFTVIEKNSEGGYIISEQHKTLVYLPHCPKQLTNNFLWCNWGMQLENCILLSNSFSSLVENHPSRVLSDTVTYIYRIQPFIEEIPLENCFQYNDIFNDTSIHYFLKEKLTKVDKGLWVKAEKPKYENSEEFITSLMVEKLNV